MTHKHTPGPWTRGYGNHVYQGERPDPVNLGRLVAVCEPSTRTKGDWDQVWANAKLIASAPELLEALEALVQAVEYTPIGVRALKAVEEARAAIKKARGE